MEKGYYKTLYGTDLVDEPASQSTIKMEKGYYLWHHWWQARTHLVAIHNKNGKGLLPEDQGFDETSVIWTVAIHNKNGKGLLH